MTHEETIRQARRALEIAIAAEQASDESDAAPTEARRAAERALADAEDAWRRERDEDEEAVVTQVRISVVSVGQAFGCRGVVRDDQDRELATTRTFPFGNRSAAYEAAEHIAQDRGWTVADETAVSS